jgi:hypothetical protein
MKHRVRRVIAATASVAVLGAGSALIIAPAQASGAHTAAKQARVKVQLVVPGKVLSVKKSLRSGYSAWAVSIARSDGSVVVGYIDVKTGIAFDWTLAASTGAPAIDLDGADSVLKPAEPPKSPATTGSESPVTGLGPGVTEPCSVSSVTGLCDGLAVPPGVSPVTGLGPGVTEPCSVSSVTGLCDGLAVPPGVSPVTGLGPDAGTGPVTAPGVSPVTGLGPVVAWPLTRSPLTGL